MFKRGDVVRLKSGGPAMTVVSVVTTNNFAETTNNFFECDWFAYGTNGRWNGEKFHGSFHAESLDACAADP